MQQIFCSSHIKTTKTQHFAEIVFSQSGTYEKEHNKRKLHFAILLLNYDIPWHLFINYGNSSPSFCDEEVAKEPFSQFLPPGTIWMGH